MWAHAHTPHHDRTRECGEGCWRLLSWEMTAPELQVDCLPAGPARLSHVQVSRQGPKGAGGRCARQVWADRRVWSQAGREAYTACVQSLAAVQVEPTSDVQGAQGTRGPGTQAPNPLLLPSTA